MTLADKMIWYRAKNRITQEQLAKECGVTTQTICGIEGGKTKPSKMTAAKIFLVVGGEQSVENFDITD